MYASRTDLATHGGGNVRALGHEAPRRQLFALRWLDGRQCVQSYLTHSTTLSRTLLFHALNCTLVPRYLAPQSLRCAACSDDVGFVAWCARSNLTAVATPFLAKWVAQTYYTEHIHGTCAVHNGTAALPCHGEACAACDGTSVCLGVDCFRNSHAVAGGLAAFGALCLLMLTVRQRYLYDRIWGYEDDVAGGSSQRKYEDDVASRKEPIARQGSGSVRF
jgi:hypothetical protein